MQTNSFSKTINNIVIVLLIVLFVFNVLITADVSFSQYQYWVCEYVLTIAILVKLIYEKRYWSLYNFLFIIYFAWLTICTIRGFYENETYWGIKNMTTNNIFCLSIPLFALLFYQPSFTLSFFKKWNICIILTFIICICNLLPTGLLQNNIGPLYMLLGAFLFMIPTWKWRIIVGALMLLMMSDMVEDRSQFLKAAIAFAVSFAVLLSRWIPKRLIQLFCIVCYVAAITFLYLGITGRYNVLASSDKEIKDTYVNGKIVGTKQESKLYADTRSAIYAEVLYSALVNDYIWTGRTPSHGNDTVLYQLEENEDLQERNMNEICLTNVFTWLGLIGVILYSLLYLEASILGAFFSKNIYIRYLAAIVSFHWLYGWVEDINDFNYMNLGLWMLIGICISPYFRDMSNEEFKIWFQSLFSYKKITDYHKFEIVKLYLSLKQTSNKKNNKNI